MVALSAADSNAGAVLAGGPTEGRRTVLFFRDLVEFTGGHLKVWDYFGHVRHSPRYAPLIAFSSRTRWDDANPWSGLLAEHASVARPSRPDVLFVAGRDWLNLPPGDRAWSPSPVINLVQHVRHADPADPLFQFLSHRAIRICVSDAVATAIGDSGRVNGPVHVIENGIDLAALPAPMGWSDRAWDVVIVALKAPELGAALCRRLASRGRRVRMIDTWLPRPAFLDALAQSRVALLLPNRTEGFYLPAIEAMALGALVVCPDCVGNRSFCRPGHNCVQPAYTFDDLADTALALLDMPPGSRQTMLTEGRGTAHRHDLANERRAFLDLLEQATDAW